MNATCDTVKSDPDLAQVNNVRMLVVGDVTRWQACGQLRGVPAGCVYVDIAQLDPIKILQYDPDLVLSPLVSDGFDAFDVAEKLGAVQFRGMYRVVANDLPDAEIIRRDIRAAAPNLDFDLLVLPRIAAP
ncbi:hypothetical protein [Yoonia vestfoldensis]|uniref:hypothetical protein n=1 Tax=Yoonia vestfoldensis TaxID=245188 RepID=UPI00038137BC|nr:hypothetical protein [Yoonia vestfoldensis]